MAAFLHIEVRIWKYRISTFIREDQAEKTDPRRRWLHTTLLDQLGISYERLDHSPAATIADCEEVKDLLGVEICKNLFLCNRQKTHFYLLVMPGNKAFHTKELSSQIGSARLPLRGQRRWRRCWG